MKISATEIRRQGIRIREQANKFNNYATEMTTDIDNIAERVKSEDSDLYSKLNKLKGAYTGFNETLKKKYDELANAMVGYAERTIANEKQAEENVDELNQKLDSVVDELNSINL